MFCLSVLSGPDHNVETAGKFIQEMFCERNLNKNKIVYPHFTTATDTSNIRVVFKVVLDTIIKRESGGGQPALSSRIVNNDNNTIDKKKNIFKLPYNFFVLCFLTSHTRKVNNVTCSNCSFNYDKDYMFVFFFFMVLTLFFFV